MRNPMMWHSTQRSLYGCKHSSQVICRILKCKPLRKAAEFVLLPFLSRFQELGLFLTSTSDVGLGWPVCEIVHPHRPISLHRIEWSRWSARSNVSWAILIGQGDWYRLFANWREQAIPYAYQEIVCAGWLWVNEDRTSSKDFDVKWWDSDSVVHGRYFGLVGAFDCPVIKCNVGEAMIENALQGWGVDQLDWYVCKP